MSGDGELLTCPRRMEELGPWRQTANVDRWTTGRYPLRQSIRTCSFCGGAHPADIIAAVKNGERVHRTAKQYKIYLGDYVKAYLQHFSQDQVDELAAAIKSCRQP